MDVINFLIDKFQYKSYLEIGVRSGTSIDNIRNTNRDREFFCVGIDPNYDTDYKITSDEFFKKYINDVNHKYDIIFIDGDHYHDQVMKDIDNSLLCLNRRGAIVLHDMLYEDGVTGGNPRGTTAWKAFARLRTTRDDLLMICVDIDWGVGVIQKLDDFDIDYNALPENFKKYNRHNLILNEGTKNDSIDEDVKDTTSKLKLYSQNAVRGRDSWQGKTIHENWLLNYFNENYQNLMNVFSVEDFKGIEYE